MHLGIAENLKDYVYFIAKNAKKASNSLAILSTEVKNNVLSQLAQKLLESVDTIQSENQKDIQLAKKNGLSEAMCDRLHLTTQRIKQMAQGVTDLISLSDPIGESIKEWDRPNGLHLIKRRVPLGVIGMIYESRPNVTIDAASLCLKSGNAVILKGGKEAFYSNKVLTQLFREVLNANAVNCDAVQFIESTDRQAVDYLLKLNDFIDVIIPRGGKTLIQKVSETSTIPVIKHYDGICHVYIDQFADLKMAKAISINAKVQRPGVCNAMETLLIHRQISPEFIRELLQDFKNLGVEIVVDDLLKRLNPDWNLASEEDWNTEYLSLKLSVKLVDDIQSAIDHINEYGSAHTDSIITQDEKEAEKFLSQVHSSTVLHNASTRFSDGFEFGFGAELGISTDKLHARGPVGLEELTTYKYIIHGTGQIRN